MKKIILILLSCLFVVTLVACGSKSEEKIVKNQWVFNDSYSEVYVPDEKLDIFRQATIGTDSDILIAHLASQVVSGTNEMYLCKNKDTQELEIVIVYNDLSNNSEITNKYRLVLNDLRKFKFENSDDDMDGSFVAATDYRKITLKDEAFQNAVGAEDAFYEPMAYLGYILEDEDVITKAFLCHTIMDDTFEENEIVILFTSEKDNAYKVDSISRIDIKDLEVIEKTE